MSIFQGIILGIIQGIAEFLPISSSGHLEVVKQLFGIGEVPILFDVFLHLATLCAVVLYFRKKIWNLLKILGRWISRKPRIEAEDSEDFISGTDARGRRTIVAVILTTLVTGVIGVLTSKLIKDDVISIKVTCAGFIVTACLLVVSSIIEKKSVSAKSNWR